MARKNKPVGHEATAEQQIVFSIHGINTRGAWQKEQLAKALSSNKFTYVPLDYGFFRTIKLLIPYCRRKQIVWFRDKYTEHHKDGNKLPSIIAHSFGTYLVARSMQMFDEISFDRIIFCGSIVQKEYPWSSIIDASRCNSLLNDFGKEDWPVYISEFAIPDAGPSGKDGFSDTHPRVIQREHPEFRHSDYFYERNYTKNWIPFLLGKDPQPLTKLDLPPRNWKFLISMSILVIVAIIVISILTCLYVPDLINWHAKYQISFPNFVAEFDKTRDDDGGIRDFLKRHEGERVEWTAVVLDSVPGEKQTAYYIGPTSNTAADDRVMAYFSPTDRFVTGTVLRMDGVIGKANVLGVTLRKCRVIEIKEIPKVEVRGP